MSLSFRPFVSVKMSPWPQVICKLFIISITGSDVISGISGVFVVIQFLSGMHKRIDRRSSVDKEKVSVREKFKP